MDRGSDNVKVDARPRKRGAEVDARPRKRGAELDARPRKRGAELDARPRKRGAELDARPRKRGAELDDAIRVAALAELVENGYAAFSVESVAARAQTGKACIYRRWPSKVELLLDAFCVLGVEQCTPDMAVAPDATTEQALKIVGRRIARMIASDAGDIMRELITEAARDPELASTIDRVFHQPRRASMLALLQRGVTRGEVRPDAVNEAVAEVLPSVLIHRIMWLRRRVTAHDLDEIVDKVLLPLVRA